MTTAAPREDEREFIYLPLLHIMSPRTLPNTHWLTCTERRAQHSSSGSRCPFWSHKTFRLLTAETRTARGNEAGCNRALTHVEQQGSIVGRRRRRRFEEDFESIGSSTSVDYMLKIRFSFSLCGLHHQRIRPRFCHGDSIYR